jgi:AcrR family transcriptional regulator
MTLGQVQDAKPAASERILTAAAELASAQPAGQAPGIDAIIRLAGVSRTTFYRHFHSKAQLLRALSSTGLDVTGLQPEDRRSQILSAALRVLAEHGPRGATISRIARASGLTPAALYWHFEGREALFRAVFEEYSAIPVIHGFSAEGVTDVRGELTRLVVSVLEILARRTDVVRVVFSQILTDRAVADLWAAEFAGAFWRDLAAYLARLSELGHLSPGDARVRAISLAGMLLFQSLAESRFGAHLGVSHEDAVAGIVDLFLSGVLPRSSPAQTQM